MTAAAHLTEPRIETDLSRCTRCDRPAPLSRDGFCWHCHKAAGSSEPRPQMHVDDARAAVRATFTALQETAADTAESAA